MKGIWTRRTGAISKSETIATLVVAMLFVLQLSFMAAAAPITLKLSFFTSDRSPVYLSAVKPFVDAVNSEGEGFLKIDVYFSGALSPKFAKDPKLVLDGIADIAFIVPGETPKRFPDLAVVGLPGLFRDIREATLVHTRLAAENALRGYKDFFVIAALASEPETIHSRKRIAALDDLKGQKIRVDNAAAAAAMKKLGASPVVFDATKTANEISSGAVDGVLLQTAQLFDFGVARLVSNHYFLPVGVAPLAVVMNRRVFESLPNRAKVLIRKYSGEWAADRWIETIVPFNRAAVKKIMTDPKRKATVATTADREAAQRAFSAVTADWAAESPRHRDLLNKIEVELAKLRSKETVK